MVAEAESGLNTSYGHFAWCLLILDDSDSLVHYDRLFVSRKKLAGQVNK